MARRKKKAAAETPEQTLERWLAGALKDERGNTPYCWSRLAGDGWEAGQVGHITLPDGMNYEKFHLPDGSGDYVVVAWSYEGDLYIV